VPFVPDISAEFSAPPEFSGGILEKDLSTGWTRTYDHQITNQILFHCANASLCKVSVAFIISLSGRVLVTGRRIFRPYLFLLAGIFRPFLLLLGAGFSGGICNCLLGFSGLNFSCMGM
jgi:hypothetical protein